MPSTLSTAAAGDDPPDARTKLLDAAERMLIDVGHAGITTRRLADEAGVNHGLVHYYYGSMEELLLSVLERFTERLIARQRTMYASPLPFVIRWRTAMRYLDEDRPYQKIWFELQAIGWNNPDVRARLAEVHRAWRDAMRDAVRDALMDAELGEDVLSLEAWITLIVTMNEGIILERLSGIDRGHDEMFEGIDRWIASVAAMPPAAGVVKKARPRNPRRK